MTPAQCASNRLAGESEPARTESLRLRLEANRKRLVFVTPAYGTALESGGTQVTRERLETLRQHFDVTVLSLNQGDTSSRSTTDGVFTGGTLRPRSFIGLLSAYVSRLPLSVWRNNPAELHKAAAPLSRSVWDVVYVDHWLLWEVAKLIPSKARVLHLHNAEPELFFRAAKRLTGFRKIVCVWEGYRSARYLRNALHLADELHLLSAADASALAARGISHITTRVFLPQVHRTRAINSGSKQLRRKQALFVGSLSWLPNSEGLRWFCREVLPHLHLDHAVAIAGGGADEKLKCELEAAEKVSHLGYVENLSPLYSESRCLIAPLLSGSGIKIKIVNALAEGLPVITTPIGAEGFPPDWGTAVYVANDGRSFAEYTSRLLNDDDLWQRASSDARAYAERHFSGTAWKRWCDEVSSVPDPDKTKQDDER